VAKKPATQPVPADPPGDSPGVDYVLGLELVEYFPPPERTGLLVGIEIQVPIV
jgi:hypothetical protein